MSYYSLSQVMVWQLPESLAGAPNTSAKKGVIFSKKVYMITYKFNPSTIKLAEWPLAPEQSSWSYTNLF